MEFLIFMETKMQTKIIDKCMESQWSSNCLNGPSFKVISYLKILLLLFTVVFSFIGQFSFSYNPKRNLAPSQKPEELKGLEVEEKLGATIHQSLSFIDEEGETVKLSKFFDNNKPVLLTIIYYGCPNLCGLHLNGLSEALKMLPEDFKKDFNFVLVSMDHSETPAMASQKKETYIKTYSLPEEKTHFLTGTKENISKLSQQIGFRFRWDDSQKIFAHHPVAYVLTPGAKISRYLYGVTFTASTLRLSLVEASEGKIGSFVDRVLLFCFQFDPKKRKYSWYAYNIMRAGGFVTLCLLLCFLLPVWIRENKKLKNKETA